MTNKELREELKKYHKPEFDTNMDAYMCSPNSYRFGDADKWIEKGFSFKKAAKKAKFHEVTPATFAARMNGKILANDDELGVAKNGDFDNGVYGISSDGIYAIARDNKMWKYTVLHEAGHLYLGHNENTPQNMFDSLTDPNYVAKREIEADLFSYFAMKELDTDLNVYGNLVAAKILFIPDKPEFELPEWFLAYTQKAAQDFIKLGR